MGTETTLSLRKFLGRSTMIGCQIYKSVIFSDPCCYCGGKSDSREHPIPRSKIHGPIAHAWGWSTVGACSKCNNKRSSVPFLIWWGRERGVFGGA